MPVDPVALKGEIESGPLAAELAPLVESGRHNAVADVLNRADRSGYVPRRHVVVTLCRWPQVDGLLRWVLRFGTMPAVAGGGPADFGLFCLCQRVSRIAANDVNVQLVLADLEEAGSQLDPLVQGGLVPAEFLAELAAGEVKVSRAAEAFGGPVSTADVSDALRS